MSEIEIQSGFAAVNGAKLYYEMAGEGQLFVMVHAGVADNRQWNNEFKAFAKGYKVLRYDMRGYGKSEPVEGEFRNLDDLVALLDRLALDEPALLMGCSMGGGLVMDFALAHPARTKALVMVGSAPGGFVPDMPEEEMGHPLSEDAEQAYKARDWDAMAEIETRIFFDGMNRTPDQVDPEMRKLAYEMNRLALAHEATGLGKRLPNIKPPAAERLDELTLPILAIVGANDEPYTLAAADYMDEHIPSARKVIITDAAHLPNMEHPGEFQRIVTEFLEGLDR